MHNYKRQKHLTHLLTNYNLPMNSHVSHSYRHIYIYIYMSVGVADMYIYIYYYYIYICGHVIVLKSAIDAKRLLLEKTIYGSYIRPILNL